METFGTLLKDPAHWEFELFLMLLFDGLIGAVVWPLIKNHIHRDLKKHNTELDRAFKSGYVKAQQDEEDMRSGRARARMVDNGEICEHDVSRRLCALCRAGACLRCNEQGQAIRGGGFFDH